jgi:hypothetical protein
MNSSVYIGWLLLNKTIISNLKELQLVVCEGRFLFCDICKISPLMCLLFLNDGGFRSNVELDNYIRLFLCEVMRLLRYPCGFKFCISRG